MRILFTTVCNDDYALGGQVMLYSMRKNIKNLDNCDFKIYYNNEFASLSQENQDKFKKIMPNIIFEHVDKELAYYGDFLNDFLLKEGVTYDRKRIWMTGVLRSKN